MLDPGASLLTTLDAACKRKSSISWTTSPAADPVCYDGSRQSQTQAKVVVDLVVDLVILVSHWQRGQFRVPEATQQLILEARSPDTYTLAGNNLQQ